jgi:Enoyl-CoA hydratase/carnithine racemase
MISSKKAKKIRLIYNYFDHNNLSNEVNLIANKIANKSSLTLKIGKKAFYEQSEMNIVDSYKYASKIMITNMMESDAEEGISAFINKRKPKWK